MAQIYLQQPFPMESGTDEEQIDLMVLRAQASGISNIRVMSFPTSFNIVPRLENVVTQLVNAGLGVDVIWDLSGVQVSEAKMNELCSITRAQTIFVISWMTHGGWETPIAWLTLFNQVAKALGHSFGFLVAGDLAFVEPATMLQNTGIITETVIDPSNLPPREAFVEPYSYNWRFRWVYTPVSAYWGVPGIFEPATTEEIKTVVDGLKSFLSADGTLNNLGKLAIKFPSDVMPTEQAEGIAYLIAQLGVTPPPRKTLAAEILPLPILLNKLWRLRTVVFTDEMHRKLHPLI